MTFQVLPLSNTLQFTACTCDEGLPVGPAETFILLGIMVLLNLGDGRSHRLPPHRRRVLPTSDTFSDLCDISESPLLIRDLENSSPGQQWAESGRASYL